MKLKRISLKNVLSFGREQIVEFNDDFTILIGPNGGGKSNLLDVAQVCLRKHFFRPWIVSYNDAGPYFQSEEMFENESQVLGKFDASAGSTVIEIELEVSAGDTGTIAYVTSNIAQLNTAAKLIRGAQAQDFYAKLKPDFVKVGDRLHYRIEDGRLSYPDRSTTNASDAFKVHLFNFQQLYYLFGDEGRKLTPPFVTFPPYRGAAGHVSTVTLANQDRFALEMPYLRATSRQPNSMLALATYHFASIKRALEANGKIGTGAFEAEETVKQVTDTLKRIGYGWDLQLKNPQKNTYEITLSCDGKTIPVARASSGEKEIINFIFGIFALNARNGVITIDEPELHLHPKWQRLLFDVLSDIQRATGNQMILATHSASFISPDSFGKIKRVARIASESHVVSLEATDIADRKDLLHLINSHNNEKLFFADKVILVEGIQDRLVFERLLREVPTTKSEIVEVLEVYGKGNFPKYRQLLNSIKVANFVIADRDYAEQIADEKVKKLFVDNLSEVGKKLGRSKSLDRQVLTTAIDAAMKSKQWDEVAKLWEYIVARHRELKSPLTADEQKTFDEFLAAQQKDRTFLLSAGAIEEYLPTGKTSLDATVELTAAADFMVQMATTGARLDELRSILKVVGEA